MPREQEQFLDVVNRDAAERRWWAAISPEALQIVELVPLVSLLGRVLAEDVHASVNVPAFDRSNVDGYAVRAEETYGASEESPRGFRFNPEEIATGIEPRFIVNPGMATPIATGAMLPRGADAVVMVEHARIDGDRLWVSRPVAPGSGVSFAGTDMAVGELVLRRGTQLTSRETGVLAAIGTSQAPVFRRPRVAILSTGNEIVEPGQPLPTASVYDSNATMLADAVLEIGGEPVRQGIVGDNEEELESAFAIGLSCDLVLFSGGTSKGVGDLSYRVLARRSPGIVVHGVALKPGKPICLGAVGTTPVVVLPGFPTSAIFTFHEFVAPVIRQMAGLRSESRHSLPARMPSRFNSEIGRTEYLLVNLVEGLDGPAAYPMGKGSGSVTTFARADGFVVIPREREFLEAGERVEVVPLGRGVEPADLVVIGSHCSGLEWLLGEVQARGFAVKSIWVGSQGGLLAAGRGECDIAGVHLLDPASGEYNRPFLPPGVRLLPGYGRMQGIVYRAGDRHFEGRSVEEAIETALLDPDCLMVNRNRGSGTRVLIDQLLVGRRPPGYAVEPRSHNAVAAAVAQGRADWGLAINTVVASYHLRFIPVLHRAIRLRDPRVTLGAASGQSLPTSAGRAGESFQAGRALVLDRGRSGMTIPGAIVLCGGLSRRMGRPKAWLPFGPEVMLQRVVRLVGEVAGPIVVVAAPGQDLPDLPEGVAIVRDPVADRGPLQGLGAGLSALPETVELAYATATDVPFLRPAWISRLVELIAGSDLAIPEIGGYLHPLAALYRRGSVLPAVEALLADDRLRPVFLLERLDSLRITGETMATVDPDLSTLRNLNTPEEYQSALVEAGFGQMSGTAGGSYA